VGLRITLFVAVGGRLAVSAAALAVRAGGRDRSITYTQLASADREYMCAETDNSKRRTGRRARERDTLQREV